MREVCLACIGFILEMTIFFAAGRLLSKALKLKEDISSRLEEKESIILFDYNTNKVFDKSKTYTVELGEEDEV